MGSLISVGRLVARRLISAILIVLVLTIVLFALQRVSATDPVRLLLGAHAPIAQVEAMRHQLGYDRPVAVQWAKYVKGLSHADLGMSLRSHRPVMTDIEQFLPATLELGFFAVLTALILALFIGVGTAAHWRGSGTISVTTISLASSPVFLLALLGILLFSRQLGWLPATGRTSFSDAPLGPTGFLTVDSLLAGRADITLDALRHLVLPALAVAFAPSVAIGRVLRSSLDTALASDYMRTARAKGLSGTSMLRRHALRNSLVTPLSMAGLQLGTVLASVIVVEVVFAWPGIGLYLAQSFPTGDFPAVTGITLLLAISYVAVNAIVDILQSLADPRIKSKSTK